MPNGLTRELLEKIRARRLDGPAWAEIEVALADLVVEAESGDDDKVFGALMVLQDYSGGRRAGGIFDDKVDQFDGEPIRTGTEDLVNRVVHKFGLDK